MGSVRGVRGNGIPVATEKECCKLRGRHYAGIRGGRAAVCGSAAVELYCREILQLASKKFYHRDHRGHGEGQENEVGSGLEQGRWPRHRSLTGEKNGVKPWGQDHGGECGRWRGAFCGQTAVVGSSSATR